MDKISYLENIEEIKRLKYSYFQACDINNLNQIKKTFATKNNLKEAPSVLDKKK